MNRKQFKYYYTLNQENNYTIKFYKENKRESIAIYHLEKILSDDLEIIKNYKLKFIAETEFKKVICAIFRNL